MKEWTRIFFSAVSDCIGERSWNKLEEVGQFIEQWQLLRNSLRITPNEWIGETNVLTLLAAAWTWSDIPRKRMADKHV